MISTPKAISVLVVVIRLLPVRRILLDKYATNYVDFVSLSVLRYIFFAKRIFCEQHFFIKSIDICLLYLYNKYVFAKDGFIANKCIMSHIDTFVVVINVVSFALFNLVTFGVPLIGHMLYDILASSGYNRLKE